VQQTQRSTGIGRRRISAVRHCQVIHQEKVARLAAGDPADFPSTQMLIELEDLTMKLWA